MFSPEHRIWEFSSAGDELDDWLPYAEDLVKKWAKQRSDEVEFGTTFEIILASLLLMDDLLPSPAKMAFARLTLDTITELDEKRISIGSLKIEPSKPGRKDDKQFKGYVIFSVREHIKNGLSKTEAYKAVAAKQFKSPETVRRIYERASKDRRDRCRGN